MSIFRLLSAILHLGNVIIDENDQDSTSVKDSDRSFATFCSLLKVDEPRMRIWLCHKRINTGVEVVNTTLNLNQVSLSLSLSAQRSSTTRQVSSRPCSRAMPWPNISIRSYSTGSSRKSTSLSNTSDNGNPSSVSWTSTGSKRSRRTVSNSSASTMPTRNYSSSSVNMCSN